MLDIEKETQMSDTFGPMCGKQFAHYDQSSRSWKTSSDIDLWGSLKSLETLPRMGYMQNGQVYEPQTSELRTIEKDYSFSWYLPTPIHSDYRVSASSPAEAARKNPRLICVHYYFPSFASKIRIKSASKNANNKTQDQYRDWGKYESGIRNWEQQTRPAPIPVEANRNGNPRLNAKFAEWLMGLPDGHITDTPGITRKHAMHMIGNGVCPQQAEEALKILLTGIQPEHTEASQ